MLFSLVPRALPHLPFNLGFFPSSSLYRREERGAVQNCLVVRDALKNACFLAPYTEHSEEKEGQASLTWDARLYPVFPDLNKGSQICLLI